MRLCKLLAIATAVVLGVFLVFDAADAQVSGNNYKQTNLVADTSNVTPAPAHVDPNLLNPWGIAFFPGAPFWISDNNSGFSTLYDQNGVLQGTFTIPPPSGSTAPATPTGIVANLSQTGFMVGGAPSLFIFDTEDGTISGWNGNGTNAILAVDNSMGGTGAVYKGLAMVTNNGSNVLLAANFRSGKVEVYDSNFRLSSLSGTFTDPNLPAGFAPFGIHTLASDKIYVTYAVQDAPKHDPVHGPGNGLVDIFDNNGNFVQRFISNGDMHTNAPWGVVIAPTGFGSFGGDFLIGNFGDGVLNAYSAAGAFIDSLRDASGKVITNLSLWDLVFGGGGQSGDQHTLYLTAGGSQEMHGVFASLAPTPANGGNAPDFAISVSPNTAIVVAGQSANFTVSISPTNGFNSALSFSCSGLPIGANCAFSTQTYSPGAGATTPTLKITTTKRMRMTVPGTAPGQGPSAAFRAGSWMPLALGFVGFFLAWLGFQGTRSHLRFPALVRAGGLVVILVSLTVAAGCGSARSNSGTPQSTSTVMVTATAGTLSHSTSITLTVK